MANLAHDTRQETATDSKVACFLTHPECVQRHGRGCSSLSAHFCSSQIQVPKASSSQANAAMPVGVQLSQGVAAHLPRWTPAMDTNGSFVASAPSATRQLCAVVCIPNAITGAGPLCLDPLQDNIPSIRNHVLISKSSPFRFGTLVQAGNGQAHRTSHRNTERGNAAKIRPLAHL
jgi:hypothetical protein